MSAPRNVLELDGGWARAGISTGRIGAGCAAVRAPQAARNDAERAKDGGLRWGALALIWDSGGRVARLARHFGVGGPRRTPRRAPDREGQSAAMKWVRINETWY